MARILIIDDEDRYALLGQRHLPEHECIGPVRDAKQALEALAEPRRGQSAIDLVLLDVHFDLDPKRLLLLPGQEWSNMDAAGREDARRLQGFLILAEIRSRYPELPVIVMTSRDDVPPQTLARGVSGEAFTYFLDDEYLDARALRLQVQRVLAGARRTVEGNFYWGKSLAMQELRRKLSVLARGSLPLLIQGATGTGKSLLAREVVHRLSGREGPFVAVDLSTVPADLVATHLFGAVKGAYTGAFAEQKGVISQAQGGTLFLDEIGNLSPQLQKMLLSVLQERRFRKVGGVQEQRVDLKLVAATNEDLAKRVREGQFRADLWMRLNPSTAIRLPALSERMEDFAASVRFFLRKALDVSEHRELIRRYVEQRGLEGIDPANFDALQVVQELPKRSRQHTLFWVLPSACMDWLHRAEWPGNFRQLEMVLCNVVLQTLVDLVQAGEGVEPAIENEHADAIVISTGSVLDAIGPWLGAEKTEEESESAQSDLAKGDGPAEERRAETEAGFRWLHEEAGRAGPRSGAFGECSVQLHQASTLNALRSAVEAQYLSALYEHCAGDLDRVGELLLGQSGAGRKVQLRLNQLGVSVRELKSGRRS